MEKNGTFNGESLIPNKSCSFNLAYISSYLFVRGCMETLAANHKLSRIKATQKFLEVVRSSQCTNEWLIFDIANALDLEPEELLNGKLLQVESLKKL
jgi:hypothetical protein